MVHSFAGNALDRADPKRRDPAWLTARLENASSRFVQFADDRPFVYLNGDGVPSGIVCAGPPHGGANRDEPVFLGVDDEDRAHFALAVATDDDGGVAGGVDDTIKLIDLRSLASQDLLRPADLGLLAHARSMLQWHGAHRFCSVCGKPSAFADGGYRRECPACGRSHFPRTDPVAIMVVVDGDDCLLGRSPHFLEGVYSALAGFIEPGESLEEAARREILEESGIHVGAVRYHSTQPWPFVSSLMIGLVCEALSRDIVIDKEELEDVRWFSRAEALTMLKDDHPDGLKTPASYAIAHHLIRAFVEGTEVETQGFFARNGLAG